MKVYVVLSLVGEYALKEFVGIYATRAIADAKVREYTDYVARSQAVFDEHREHMAKLRFKDDASRVEYAEKRVAEQLEKVGCVEHMDERIVQECEVIEPEPIVSQSIEDSIIHSI